MKVGDQGKGKGKVNDKGKGKGKLRYKETGKAIIIDGVVDIASDVDSEGYHSEDIPIRMSADMDENDLSFKSSIQKLT